MKNQILILITLILLLFKRQENIDLYISNSNYELNLKTGDFKINWYNNYKDKMNYLK
jgi:hypothetical protein